MNQKEYICIGRVFSINILQIRRKIRIDVVKDYGAMLLLKSLYHRLTDIGGEKSPFPVKLPQNCADSASTAVIKDFVEIHQQMVKALLWKLALIGRKIVFTSYFIRSIWQFILHLLKESLFRSEIGTG